MKLRNYCSKPPSFVPSTVILLTFLSLVFLNPLPVKAELINFYDNWGDQGFSLISQDDGGVEIVYSIEQLMIADFQIDGQIWQTVSIPGAFLPNLEGAPNLPNTARFIAVPEGASVRLEILDSRVETYSSIDVIPSFAIPRETDDSELTYIPDSAVYSVDAYYPESPVMVSDITQMRGVDVVKLGVTPFQYNPVTKELLVYRDLRIKLDFIGGDGHFGEDRLRSKYWEPILMSNLLNYESLPEIDFFSRISGATDDEDCEYLIIVPDDPDFIAWADSIKLWRNQQGIITGVATISEIGGNDAGLIEDFIDEAYNTWVIPPVAVLILSDYQSSGDTYGISSPIYNNYCVSDNMYADINNDLLPDLSIARICAQDNDDLQTMVTKFLDYERYPPQDSYFYENPLFAGGWQTERWFILCTEIVWGYFHNIHSLDSPREYAIYEGTPGDIWSTNNNTWQVVNYFGPSGLGYIPETPSYLTDWTGNASGVNEALNNGAMFLLHRDHGSEVGWGEPGYNIASLGGLNNEYLPYVFSINCLTGKYNLPSNCFAEVFHRMEEGALGLMAASEVSYSFVNDAYTWGVFDSMWPDFDPYYGNDLPGSATLRPCFANTYGKYYLESNSWVGGYSKPVTYNLFHHHGDAFLTLYTQVPEVISVTHQPVLFSGADEFIVTADSGAIVALTVDGEIIGAAESDGSTMVMPIEPQLPGNTLVITATEHNHYRYTDEIDIIPDQDVYVLYYSLEIDDSMGDNDGMLDLGEGANLNIAVRNVGIQTAENVTITIESEDEYIVITDGEEYYGNIASDSIITVEGGFSISAGSELPDQHEIDFVLSATDGDCTWVSDFSITGHSPVCEYESLVIDDRNGNQNGILDPGETADFYVTIRNNGSDDADNLDFEIDTEELLVILPGGIAEIEQIPAGQSTEVQFQGISVHENTPQGWEIDFAVYIEAESGYSDIIEFSITSGDELYQPSGPDPYGYFAYDNNDGVMAPDYDWLEIAPLAGGSGNVLTISSNQTVQVDIPFDFQFYGEEFNIISVCSNGWMCFGECNSFIPVNLPIPHTVEPNYMVAPFWDDLTMDSQSQICTYYNSIEHKFYIEWYNIGHNGSMSSRETFQVVLYDPAYFSTASGDGDIVINYHTVSSSTSWCTVGIEDGAGEVGLQYLYNSQYLWHASQLNDGLAVRYSTEYFVDPHAPEPFSLLSPASGDTIWSLSADFVWQSTEDPDPGQEPVYEVWIDTTESMITKWRIAQNLPDTTFTFADLDDDENYYWNVRAADINSAGTWAMPYSLTTFLPEPPSNFSLSAPPDGSILGYYQIIFQWESSTDPDPGDEIEYTLWFVNGADSVGYYAQVESLQVNPDTVGILIPGEDAMWYVTAHSIHPDIFIESNERFGFSQTTGIEDRLVGDVPTEYCLFPNFPNPFNPVTTIRFGVPQTAPVKLTVYDVLGRRTAVLIDGQYQPGYYIANWNAADNASGIYFVRMESKGFNRTMKILLLQ